MKTLVEQLQSQGGLTDTDTSTVPSAGVKIVEDNDNTAAIWRKLDGTVHKLYEFKKEKKTIIEVYHE
jgi:hypothetical protein